MSVDRRLREGLRTAAEDVHVSGYEAYEAVTVGARRRRAWTRARNAAAVLTAAAAVVAAYVVVGSPSLRTTSPIPASTPTPAPPTQSAAAPVEGTWRAGPLPMSVLVANLKAHKLNKWVPAYLGANTATTQFTFTLKLQGGQLTLTRALDGVSQGVEDSESYAVSGDRITFTPIGTGCASTFGWQVTGDQLAFTFISDTCPPYRGTPDEVFMRALYASTPYSRSTP
jgi:hypothetical protein